MAPGAPVSVLLVVAGGYDPSQHLRAWSAGHIYQRTEPDGSVIVRSTRGIFAGVDVRFRASDVRDTTEG